MTGPTIAAVLALIGALMAFSIGAALLDQATLAVLAGTGCVSLAGRTARRLLPTGRPRRGSARHGD
ncbi:hypothetical protein AB0H83_34950 [Dactylosporangium sp. NPDC050688]|uniref:hypothetical protein n=1 Tax=Dactylosporangium sp. NPDC050688 TaxID=3157217 RepID=UPI0033C6A9D7